VSLEEVECLPSDVWMSLQVVHNLLNGLPLHGMPPWRTASPGLKTLRSLPYVRQWTLVVGRRRLVLLQSARAPEQGLPHRQHAPRPMRSRE
jgi:hypothetical protein